MNVSFVLSCAISAQAGPRCPMNAQTGQDRTQHDKTRQEFQHCAVSLGCGQVLWWRRVTRKREVDFRTVFAFHELYRRACSHIITPDVRGCPCSLTACSLNTCGSHLFFFLSPLEVVEKSRVALSGCLGTRLMMEPDGCAPPPCLRSVTVHR